MSGDVRVFNNIKTSANIKFFYPARQATERNSCYADRNVRGSCTMPPSKPVWTSLNMVIFQPVMRLTPDNTKQ
jgi:hypothetical protein